MNINQKCCQERKQLKLRAPVVATYADYFWIIMLTSCLKNEIDKLGSSKTTSKHFCETFCLCCNNKIVTEYCYEWLQFYRQIYRTKKS